ncbi:MAG: tetratricopeptide repeat protein [Blastocatellia bacterium]|nr:tetratricopeptide repeat protein [Blastocatellia bacterium]
MKKLLIISVLLTFSAIAVFAQKMRTVTIITEPEATVWVNDIKRGATDSSGKLTIKLVPAGAQKVRVRAYSFKEATQSLLPTQNQIQINLVKTTDKAELTFHEAEKMMKIDRQKAIELYQKAASLRPKYYEAYIEMARAMSDAGDNESALEAIANARKARPGFPEASAVEGRIHKSDGDEEKAIVSYKRAIREGAGFQPEAHTGLGLLYKEKAEGFAASGDFENEAATYKLAAAELKPHLLNCREQNLFCMNYSEMFMKKCRNILKQLPPTKSICGFSRIQMKQRRFVRILCK